MKKALIIKGDNGENRGVLEIATGDGCHRHRHAIALRWASVFLISCLAFSQFSFAADVKIYTAANPPPVPKLEELPLRESVSQYGITWTFEKPARVGQFVNGDYYVVGPVKISKLDPKPLFGDEVPESELGNREKLAVRNRSYVRHGSMLNPPARAVVSYDSGIRNYFKPDFAAKLPIEMKPGDTLVSSISLMMGEKSAFPYHDTGGYREHHDDCPTKTAAVLTCVEKPLAADAFRPSYCDREQKIYYARNLRRDLLLNLKRTPKTPEVSFWVRIFQRPWLNTCFFGFEQPMENMPHYGQWVGQAQSVAGLLLLCDFKAKEKEPLLINVVQVGIDYWGLVRAGHPGWPGFGGHGSGRKFPIVFAGYMLDDKEMLEPTRTFPNVEFGEDNQTVYGKGWTGATALFGGHRGEKAARETGKQVGPYEHLHPSQWSKSNYGTECYRRANTSSSWVGQALALRLLGLEKHWRHDAFFDYVDRWMTEDDREHRREIMKYWPEVKMDDKAYWVQQGNTREPFVREMWLKYRKTINSDKK